MTRSLTEPKGSEHELFAYWSSEHDCWPTVQHQLLVAISKHSQHNILIIIMIYNDTDARQQSHSQNQSILSPRITTENYGGHEDISRSIANAYMLSYTRDGHVARVI